MKDACPEAVFRISPLRPPTDVCWWSNGDTSRETGVDVALGLCCLQSHGGSKKGRKEGRKERVSNLVPLFARHVEGKARHESALNSSGSSVLGAFFCICPALSSPGFFSLDSFESQLDLCERRVFFDCDRTLVKMTVTDCRMYEAKYPEVDDVVMVQVISFGSWHSLFSQLFSISGCCD